MRLGQFFPSSVAVGLLASVWVIYARNLYIAQGSIIRVFCVNLCGFGGGGFGGCDCKMEKKNGIVSLR